MTLILSMLLGIFSIGGVQVKPDPGIPGMMPQMMQHCPMQLQGTEVTVENTATGIALTFTNNSDKVADLQRRVERMAIMHDAERLNESMMKPHMIAATVKYEAIENGARLTLTPKDSTKLAEFRTQVRAHVDRMKHDGCSMMRDMMRDHSHHP